MRKLGVLIGINLRALLSALRLGSSKKSKATGIGALLLLGVLAVYIAGVYSFTFALQLSSIGLLEYLIPMMAIMGCLMSVVMTVQAASGFIFSGRDTDLMLSLPVSAFSVMLSRITALYIENLAFIGLFMLTSGVAGAINGLGGLGYYLSLVVGTLMLTFLTTMLTMVISFVAAFITSRFPHHSVFSTILYFAFFLLVMIGAFQVSNVGNLLLTNQTGFDRLLNGALLPFGLLKNGLEGNLLSLTQRSTVCECRTFSTACMDFPPAGINRYCRRLHPELSAIITVWERSLRAVSFQHCLRVRSNGTLEAASICLIPDLAQSC